MNARVARLAFKARPEWAYPENAEHQAAYLRAIAFLRRGGRSRWIVDQASITPSWRALPTEGIA